MSSNYLPTAAAFPQITPISSRVPAPLSSTANSSRQQFDPPSSTLPVASFTPQKRDDITVQNNKFGAVRDVPWPDRLAAWQRALNYVEMEGKELKDHPNFVEFRGYPFLDPFTFSSIPENFTHRSKMIACWVYIRSAWISLMVNQDLGTTTAFASPQDWKDFLRNHVGPCLGLFPSPRRPVESASLAPKHCMCGPQLPPLELGNHPKS